MFSLVSLFIGLKIAIHFFANGLGQKLLKWLIKCRLLKCISKESIQMSGQMQMFPKYRVIQQILKSDLKVLKNHQNRIFFGVKIQKYRKFDTYKN